MVLANAVVDDALSPDLPLGLELEVSIRPEGAERFIEEVRGDDPGLASYLRIEERELEASGTAGRPCAPASRSPGHRAD